MKLIQLTMEQEMNRQFAVLLLLLIITGPILAAPSGGGILKTGMVIQKWNIESLTDPISEGTFPLELTYSLRENLSLQLNHSPAWSRFGDYNLSGLSDTWLRTSYRLGDKRTLLSAGIGIPTGQTRLGNSEMTMTSLLSQYVFKFQLPVFGQGLTLSAGAAYAYPVTNQFTIGIGLNYVYRGSYKLSKLQPQAYDPGEQVGVNIGFDYAGSSRWRSFVDILLNYYTADAIANTEVFAAGPKLSARAGVHYQVSFGQVWLRGCYRHRGKNESWNGQSLALESKNSNITQRELDGGTKIRLTDILLLNVQGEIRSYVENELGHGWVDLFGTGLGYELMLSRSFTLAMAFKIFFGDGEFAAANRSYSGTEFFISTQWKFNN